MTRAFTVVGCVLTGTVLTGKVFGFVRLQMFLDPDLAGALVAVG
jgi:hypothetical protein